MEEEKEVVNNEEYERVTPIIGYYMKSNNIARIIQREYVHYSQQVGKDN